MLQQHLCTLQQYVTAAACVTAAMCVAAATPAAAVGQNRIDRTISCVVLARACASPVMKFSPWQFSDNHR
jgi:hypothetical protein